MRCGSILAHRGARGTAWAAALAALLGLGAGAAGAGGPGGLVRERVTGAEFPAVVDFRHEGRAYELTLTGLAVRRIAVFNVYGIAHYLETPVSSPARAADLARVLEDGPAKQVTLYFARDLAGDRISDALVKSIRRNGDEIELKVAAAAIDRFAAVVRHDVKKGERFTVRWLPGGVMISIFAGQEVLSLRNATFARLLWSVWFGDDAVVDRASLLGLDARAS